MADSPVQINSNQSEVQGQAHGQVTPPQHDGRHWVDETAVVTDRVILDVNDPLAVQVPEGVGASTAGHESPLAQALKRGAPEDVFSAGTALPPDSTPEVKADDSADKKNGSKS